MKNRDFFCSELSTVNGVTSREAISARSIGDFDGSSSLLDPPCRVLTIGPYWVQLRAENRCTEVRLQGRWTSTHTSCCVKSKRATARRSHIIWLRWIQSAFVPTVLCPGNDVRDRISGARLDQNLLAALPISIFPQDNLYRGKYVNIY